MRGLVDIHCHLLAGLDDGPATAAEALAMCRMMRAEGVGAVAATAHLGEEWPEVTPARIRAAVEELKAALRREGIAIAAHPSAEVMIRPELEQAWDRNELMGVADGRRFVLVEVPWMAFVDPGDLVERLVARGVQPILAHPERHPEFLRDARLVETLIARGCLIQVNAQSVVRPSSPADGRLIRSWFQRGMVHLVASDGHSPDRRPPRLAAAYETISSWIGSSGADRVCCIHGLMVCDGRPLKAAEPARSRKRRFPWLSF